MIILHYHYFLIKTNAVASREPTRILMVIWVKKLQTELLVEICYKSLARAIVEVFLMKLS